MESFKNKQNPALRLLISVGIGLGGFLGAYSPFLMMLYPAFLGFILPAWGMTPYVAALCVSIASAAAACGLTAGLVYYLAGFLPAALVIGLFLRNKSPYRLAAAYAAGAMAIACYLSLCLPSILAGADPFSEVTQALRTFLDGMVQMAAAMPEAAELVPAFKAYGSVMVQMAPELTVLVVMTLGMGFGFFDVLIARGLAKKSGAQLRDMSAFWLWQLPQSFVWGLVILILGAVAVNLLSMTNAGAVTMAVECIAVLPFALMGMCFTEFNSRIIRKRSPGRRALSYVLIVLFLPYSILGLAFVGLLERLLKVRKRFLDSQGGKS